jgi:two-component system, OmpR family, response regulator VanR
MRVLLVEDDAALADAIARGLRREMFAVDIAADGEVALEKLSLVDYDLVVLDRNLPGVHGDTVCEQLAHGGSIARVLMLSASADVDQRVEGLLIGADDYLPKPFAMVELVARLRALGRRVPRALPTVLRWNDVWLDPARRTAGRDDRALNLTNREFAVMETLMAAEGAVVSAEELMERVWDDRLDPFSNAVRVTILTLRRKLGEPPVVITLPGAGYRLA